MFVKKNPYPNHADRPMLFLIILCLLFAPFAIFIGYDPISALIPLSTAAITTYFYVKQYCNRLHSVLWTTVFYLPLMGLSLFTSTVI